MDELQRQKMIQELEKKIAELQLGISQRRQSMARFNITTSGRRAGKSVASISGTEKWNHCGSRSNSANPCRRS